jgi:phospholipid-translocating ATPase
MTFTSGGIIMLLSLLLFESEFLHIVAISFTALVLNELIMVALEITTWHTYMVLSELGTAAVYFGSMAVLPAYFGESHRRTFSLLDAGNGE